MENPPNPYEPTPHDTSKPNFHMLYYVLVVVGTAIIVLALYNLIILRWSSNVTNPRSPQSVSREIRSTSSRRLDNLNLNNFKYKKDGAAQYEGNVYECAVCLSIYEEGEELRQFPNCKHSFHAPCIDTWLYSHMDCPLCRSPVESLILRRRLDSTPPV